MNKNIMNKHICLILILTSIFVFLSTACSQKAQKNSEAQINVVRFIEDTTVTCNVNKYKMLHYSINDYKKIKTKNVWITYSFLEDKKHLKTVNELLENGNNILIQRYKLTSFDVYNLFSIPKSKRAMKSSQKQELLDIKLPLIRYGIMIFKYKSFYYAIGINSINNGTIEDLLVTFTFDKNKMIG